MSRASTTPRSSERDGRRSRFMRHAGLLLVSVWALASVACAGSSPPVSSGNGASTLPGLAWSEAGGASGSVRASAAPMPSADPAFRLAFDEQFDGDRLDLARWKSGMPWGDLTTGEAQVYRPSALKVGSGALTITATKGGSQGASYASGAINSKGRYEFKYGYLEARARVPRGRGLWPAIWTQTAGGGSFNEIDLLEVLGQDTLTNHVNLHTDSNLWRAGKAVSGPDLSAGFHTYAVDWEPDKVVWYLDGTEVFRATAHVPANPMLIIANLSVGGPSSWSGPPNAETPFPAEFVIDYIKVYQRK